MNAVTFDETTVIVARMLMDDELEPTLEELKAEYAKETKKPTEEQDADYIITLELLIRDKKADLSDPQALNQRKKRRHSILKAILHYEMSKPSSSMNENLVNAITSVMRKEGLLSIKLFSV